MSEDAVYLKFCTSFWGSLWEPATSPVAVATAKCPHRHFFLLSFFFVPLVSKKKRAKGLNVHNLSVKTLSFRFNYSLNFIGANCLSAFSLVL